MLISPSLHTGLDLKDERSRFQIIVKVPYPNRNDKWIEAKRMRDRKLVRLADFNKTRTSIWEVGEIKGRLGQDVCAGFSIWDVCIEKSLANVV